MSYEIQSDVPLPPRMFRHRDGYSPTYPFSKMLVGDSFEMEAPVVTPATQPTEKEFPLMVKRLHSAAYCWARHHNNGFRFTVRRTVLGARIWRIA